MEQGVSCATADDAAERSSAQNFVLILMDHFVQDRHRLRRYRCHLCLCHRMQEGLDELMTVIVSCFDDVLDGPHVALVALSKPATSKCMLDVLLRNHMAAQT